MAQTLLSTRPVGSAISRMLFSSTSVGTPDARFGQAIHSPPLGKIALPSPGSLLVSDDLFVSNKAATSTPEPGRRRCTTESGNSASTPGGAFRNRIVIPSRTPSFEASGVPLYPANRVQRAGRRIVHKGGPSLTGRSSCSTS